MKRASRPRLSVLGFAILVGPLVAGSTGEARFISVTPGPGTPLQDAIDSAEDGDRVVGGFAFYESIHIAKRIKLEGVTLEAGCAAPSAVTIAADGVELKQVVISGGTVATIDAQGVSNLSFRGQVQNGCTGTPYGVRLLDVDRVKTTLFQVGYLGPIPYATAAIYVANIEPEARVRLRKASFSNAPVGILAENVGPNGLLINDAVVFDDGNQFTNDLQRGILFRNVDGCRIVRASIGGNPAMGIEFDADSSENLVLRTSASGVLDNGTGNCGTGNTGAGGLPPC